MIFVLLTPCLHCKSRTRLPPWSWARALALDGSSSPIASHCVVRRQDDDIQMAVGLGMSWHQATGLLASLLGTRTLLGAKGIATRSKDATRGSWHRY